MNRVIEQKWSWIEGSHGMRNQLLDNLSDADLAFNPGGQNMTFGALCREMGEIEHAYVESFKHFKQDFNYRNTEPGLENSVARLKGWFQALDDDMKATVGALDDEDMKKCIDRGGFVPAVDLQLDIYLQALLIFFGKATIFLKCMNRSLPGAFKDYIG